MEERKSQSGEGLYHFKYDRVCEFLEKSMSKLSSILREFNDELVNLRNTEKVPIYSTVSRLKGSDSLYLKLKRIEWGQVFTFDFFTNRLTVE